MASAFACPILQSVYENSLKMPFDIAMFDESDKRSISYGRFYNEVIKTSKFLRYHSFGSGDRAAVMLNNSIEFPIIHLAIWACGGTVVGSSMLLSADELRYQWTDSHTSVVFTTKSHLEIVLAAARDCPTIRLIICVRPTADCEVHMDIVKTSVSIDSIALIYYTSGTTGVQKGVIHTHRSFLACVGSFARFVLHDITRAANADPEDALKKHQILTTPFFHMMGFGYLNACFVTGLPAVIHFNADAGQLLKMVEEYETIFLLTYPSMAQNLIIRDNVDMGSVKVIVSSGSRLRREVADAFVERFPTVKYLAQGYGMTEVGFSHYPLLNEKCSVDTIGIPAKEFEQKVLDIDHTRECQPGELGELCLRGPTLTMGYLNREKETRELIDEEGWLHTGDLAFANEIGEVHLVDRIKDMFTVEYKGTKNRIFPSVIEKVLLNCSKVEDAAVVGCGDGKGNTLVRAFIVRENPELEHDIINDLVRDNLPVFMWLTGGVQFVQRIPRSAGGKILRRYLDIDLHDARNAA